MSVTQFESDAPPLTAPLSYFRSADLALAGGKGANLGELTQAGFEVPPGFVITTAAYDLLLQENNLQARLESLLASLQPNDSNSIQKVSGHVRRLLQQSTMPVRIADEIIQAYRRLGNGAVAVRSSATAEDLPEAAFAGQQETFLNVIGDQALLDATRACWMSLWSERAMSYRVQKNVDQNTIKLAVVVQKMVPAVVAGVMFTANPVSGARDEIIIDANPGLGEAVVSGMVTPDHFVVKKHGLRIKEQERGGREVVIRSKTGGGTEHITSSQDFTDATLSLPALHRLSKLGIEIERHYGAHQDIEWAWMKDGTKTGKFLILQARPVTALPEPINVSGPMRIVLPLLAEMWTTRPYPLDMSTFTGAVERAIGNLLVTMIGRSAPNPDEAFQEEDGVVIQFRPPQVRPSPGMLFMPWITMWRTRGNDPARWEADPLLTEFITQARALEQRNLQAITWTQNIETIDEALALIPLAMKLREHYFPQTLLGFASLWLLLALTRHGDRFAKLVSGVKTKTTETNQALEDLAMQIRNNSELHQLFQSTEAGALRAELIISQSGQAFLDGFELFLDRYGHRETALTISQPAWKDQPDTVLAILKILVESEPKRPESYDAWQHARDELISHSILGSPVLRNLFLRSLAKVRALFQIREDTHFYVTLLQPPIRHVALELGRRFMEERALDRTEDVFHLHLAELKAFGGSWPLSEDRIAQVRALIARRKAKRESLVNKPMVDPRLLTNTSQPGGGNILLQGTSGSPGIGRGPARIVHDVSEFGKLRAGDVLVAPATNPAWTPLFQRAVAVVVDTGGIASHAAIVAREYGVPAVMGTLRGTQELKDGQWVIVDGSRGTIMTAEEPK